MHTHNQKSISDKASLTMGVRGLSTDEQDFKSVNSPNKFVITGGERRRFILTINSVLSVSTMIRFRSVTGEHDDKTSPCQQIQPKPG